MANIQFGNTWWGERFLDALEQIDFSNRLPRGVRYARNGSVLKIVLNDTLIQASVQGTRRTPYKVMVKAKQFSPLEVKEILEVIKTSPYYLSQLHAGLLPVELHEECQKKKIQLFPRSWRDLGMQCSCPDWAVPCKHLAAVIYMIANEIDKDPFLIFRLHGLDLKQALLDENEHKKESIPTFLSLTEPTNTELVHDTNEIDFSTITDMLPTLEQVLLAKPLFCPDRDFKRDYLVFVKDLSKKTKALLSSIETAEQQPRILYDTCKVTYKKGKANIVVSRGSQKQSFKESNIQELLTYLQAFSLQNRETYPLHLQILLLTHSFALRLLENHAVVPDILSISKDTYLIRWIAASFNPSIRHIRDQLASLLAGKNLVYLDTDALNSEQQVNQLVSLFASAYMQILIPEEKIADSDEHTLFFQGKLYQPSSFSQRGNPLAMQLWLGRLFLSSSKVHPVICLKEHADDTFICEIKVQEGNQQTQPLSNHLSQKNDCAALLRDLSLLGTYLPEIHEALKNNGTTLVGGDAFLQSWFAAMDILSALGVSLIIPKSLKKALTPHLRVAISKTSNEAAQSFVSLKELLSVSWKLQIGDDSIDPHVLDQMIEKGRSYVQFKGQFVHLDEKEILKLKKRMEKELRFSSLDLLKAHLLGTFEDQPIIADKQVKDVFDSLLAQKSAKLPACFTAQLRPYQERGYQWLVHNHNIGLGSLLADDMGLGKTVQVIALLAHLQERKVIHLKKPALIIVPASLISNWIAEINRFAPSLSTYAFHGQKRSEQEKAHCIITTYATVRNDTELLCKTKFSVAVLDEAQNIKNNQTSQSKAVQKIKYDWALALTGTPVENRLLDFYSIVDSVMKGYLGSRASFVQQYCIPIERYQDARTSQAFKTLTAPLMLRRVKTDKTVIADLPDKLVSDKYANLTLEQKVLYQQIVEQTEKTLQDKDGISKKGAVFALMTALKQVCCHPALYCETAGKEAALSGKTTLLLDLIKTIHDRGEKVLIFTQYAQMGHLLQEVFQDQLGEKGLFLYGGSSRAQRDSMVEAFQTDPSAYLMILSIKAGGTGLNLTAASHVIHYDLWWNPAVENQATDRAFRIGQDKNVQVHRLITKGTFEEKINEMLLTKQELVQQVVTKGETWLTELSDDELRDLISLREEST